MPIDKEIGYYKDVIVSKLYSQCHLIKIPVGFYMEFDKKLH